MHYTQNLEEDLFFILEIADIKNSTKQNKAYVMVQPFSTYGHKAGLNKTFKMAIKTKTKFDTHVQSDKPKQTLRAALK